MLILILDQKIKSRPFVWKKIKSMLMLMLILDQKVTSGFHLDVDVDLRSKDQNGLDLDLRSKDHNRLDQLI